MLKPLPCMCWSCSDGPLMAVRARVHTALATYCSGYRHSSCSCSCSTELRLGQPASCNSIKKACPLQQLQGQFAVQPGKLSISSTKKGACCWCRSWRLRAGWSWSGTLP